MDIFHIYIMRNYDKAPKLCKTGPDGNMGQKEQVRIWKKPKARFIHTNIWKHFSLGNVFSRFFFIFPFAEPPCYIVTSMRPVVVCWLYLLKIPPQASTQEAAARAAHTSSVSFCIPPAKY